ncbi:MAG: flagellar basal body-associated FliL family protein [Deltaproteobacteria bacterium]|nr:flagellar basal body-associated FliL family protein [Deltaproteobacteria bacterium]
MDDDAELPPPPSKMKKTLPFVGVLLLGAGGGYGASLALPSSAQASEGEHGEAPAEGDHGEAADAPTEGGHGAAPAAEGEHGGPSSHGGKAAVSAGMTGDSIVTSLGTFTVNLRGSGGGRVLRMEVQVDSDAQDASAVTAKAAQLRDSIITGVSDYTWSELEGVDGKTRLRDELHARVNGVLGPQGGVDRIYFTQFVVQ